MYNQHLYGESWHTTYSTVDLIDGVEPNKSDDGCSKTADAGEDVHLKTR